MQDYESKHSGEEIDAILDAVANKVDKVEGKDLSTEDFTTALKNRLESLQNYDDTSIREVVENIIELTDDFNQDIAELYRIKQNTCYILPFDLVALKRVVLGEIDAVAFTPDIFDAIQKNTLILLPKVIDETNGYQVVTQANYYADDVEMYLTIVDDEYDIHISGIFNNGNYLITSSNIVLIPKQKPITDLDAIREGAAKGKTSVQGLVVNNKQLTPDTKGNISLPKIPTAIDIANMGFTQNEGTVTGVMVNGESKSPNSEGIVDLGTIGGGGVGDVSFIDNNSLQGLPFGYIGGYYRSYEFDGTSSAEVNLGYIDNYYIDTIAIAHNDILYEERISRLMGDGKLLGTVVVRVDDEYNLYVKQVAPKKTTFGWRIYTEKQLMPDRWVDLESYYTKEEVTSAIATAITTTLNTPV